MMTYGKGDAGYTSLIGGKRVPKYHLRPETYGAVDEATSILGMARSTTANPRTAEILHGIQQDLYLLMAELATPEGHPGIEAYMTTEEKVQGLERILDELQHEVQLPHEFVIPGEVFSSAAIDTARAVVRRAERWAARMVSRKMLQNPQVLRYLNRLSTLLYVLARYQEVIEGHHFDLTDRPQRTPRPSKKEEE